MITTKSMKLLALSMLSLATMTGWSQEIDLPGDGLAHPRFSQHESRQFTKQQKADKETVNIKTARKIMTRADDLSIEGAWSFLMGDFYAESGWGEMEMTYQATILKEGDDTIVRFDNIDEPYFSLIADYDETSGLLTFNFRYVTQEVYHMVKVNMYQNPFVYVYEDNDEYTSFQSITAQFSVEDTSHGPQPTIDFDYYNSEKGFSWEMWGSHETENAENLVASYAMDAISAIPTEYSFDTENWVDMGDATFIDGWVLPGLGIDQNLPENQYKVPVQKHKYTQGVIRLVDPYKYGPAAEYNQSDYPGVIEIDLRNPEYVLINPNMVPSGFSNIDMGITILYTYNYYVSFLLQNPMLIGQSPDIVCLIFPGEMPRTTFRGREITFTPGEENKGTVPEPNIQKVYDATYGTQMNYFGGSAWYNDQGVSKDMTTKIILNNGLNGVESIIDDDFNKPVVYFNLQGVEVKNPQPGQILVRKQGNSTRKVIY